MSALRGALKAAKLTPALIDQPHDVRRRAARLHHAQGWRPAIPKAKKRRKQKNRATFLHKRTDARLDDGKIDGNGAKRKGDEPSDHGKVEVVVTRGRGHGNFP
ncbi:MAG: hypothetical protein ACR2KT_13525 [Methylocella sp.]|nr:MAG: hypothetical protein DLM68_13405 [Hyphomicrobiales bacterium]